MGPDRPGVRSQGGSGADKHPGPDLPPEGRRKPSAPLRMAGRNGSQRVDLFPGLRPVRHAEHSREDLRNPGPGACGRRHRGELLHRRLGPRRTGEGCPEKGTETASSQKAGTQEEGRRGLRRSCGSPGPRPLPPDEPRRDRKGDLQGLRLGRQEKQPGECRMVERVQDPHPLGRGRDPARGLGDLGLGPRLPARPVPGQEDEGAVPECSVYPHRCGL